MSNIYFERGSRFSIEELRAMIGVQFKSELFVLNNEGLQMFRDSTNDDISYPCVESGYPTEQINFTYMLSMIDFIRVQLFDVDENYKTLTYGINNACIVEPIFTTDSFTMTCTIKDVKIRGEKCWMTTTYEIFANGREKPSVKSELVSCLVPKM